MSTAKIGFGVLSALAFHALGCGGGDCDAAYETMKKCSKGADKFGDKSDFVSACKIALNSKMKDSVEAELKCAKEDSCEAFEKCQKAKEGARRAGDIAKYAESGDWGRAFSRCTLSPENFSDESFKSECNKVFANADKLADKDIQSMMYRCTGDKDAAKIPEFMKACGVLANKRLGTATTAVTAARDAGKRDYTACSNLKEAAGIIDGSKDTGPNVTKAKAACAEMDAAENAAKGIADASKNAKDAKTSTPYQCKSTVDELDKIATPWATKTRDALLKACYVELGLVILDVEGAKATSYCPFQVKEVLAAAKKYELATKHPELGAAIAKLPKSCS